MFDTEILSLPFQAKELPTFKDNDFLNEGHKLQIGDDNKKYFLEKLKRDVEVRNAAGFHLVCCRIAQEALIWLFFIYYLISLGLVSNLNTL